MGESTLILGLGNALLADEGVGVEVIRRLEAELGHRDDLIFLDGGTLSFTLAAAIAAGRRVSIQIITRFDPISKMPSRPLFRGWLDKKAPAFRPGLL